MFRYCCALLLAFFVFQIASAQLMQSGRGMYVDKFFRTSINSSGAIIVDPNFSILSIPSKENALLQYAKENHINYLVLYDLQRILGNSVYEGYLCAFLEKAKTLYCIEKIGVASSCASMFDNIASMNPSPPVSLSKSNNTDLKNRLDFIQKSIRIGEKQFMRSEVAKLSLRAITFNEQCAYKFDVLVTEFEFWNPGTDNCTDASISKDQKYQNFQTMVTDMDVIRDGYNSTHSGHQIYIETYLGYLNQNTLYTHQTIADWIDGSYNGKRRVDRVNQHYYGTDPAKFYSRTTAGQNNSGYYLTRFLDFCQSTTNNQTQVMPIMSTENTLWGAGQSYLGAWFNQGVNNNIFTAEKMWYNDWYDDAVNYHASTVGSPTLGSIVKPGNVLWFTSEQMNGHLNNPVMFTSNSPVCVAAGQNGTLQFQYLGPIEKGLSYKFYITDSGSSVIRCGSNNSVTWPAYNAVTQTSINLNSTIGNCSLPSGVYDAHLELSYDSCSTYIVPLVKVSVVNSGKIVALTNTTACQGNPVYLQASSTGSGTTTYAWYDGAAAISGATLSTYAPTSTGLHNYSCKITSSVGACSANLSNVIPVTINTYPSASITLQSLSGCSAVLKANPSSSSYYWFNGATSSTTTAIKGGSYSVSVTNSGCTRTASYTHKTVKVDYVQQVNPCQSTTNGSITVNMYWGTSPYTLSWSGPITGSSSGNAAGNKTINNLSSGTYNFTITDAGGCTNSLSVILPTNVSPSSSSNSPICSGGNLNLTSSGGVSYSWTGPGGFTSANQNPAIQNVSPANSGNYIVVISGTNGCSASSTVNVVVNTNPQATITVANNFCEGDTIKLFSGSASVYSWTGPAGFTSSMQNPVLSNSTLLNSGSYTLTVSNAVGCQASASAQVTIIPSVMYYADADADGYGNTAIGKMLCAPSGIYVTVVSGDCNDSNNAIHPGAIEICGNGIDDDCNGIVDDSCNIIIHVKLFIEGYYDGGGIMQAVINPLQYPNLCDTITLELHNAITPFQIILSMKGILDIYGNGYFNFPPSTAGHNYFLVMKHRNALETWSSNAVSITNAANDYDFTTSASKAFGNNLADLGGGTFALYSGDVSNGLILAQDGLINAADYNGLISSTYDFNTGYHRCDLNGDGIVEGSDYSIIEKNITRNIVVIRP